MKADAVLRSAWHGEHLTVQTGICWELCLLLQGQARPALLLLGDREVLPSTSRQGFGLCCPYRAHVEARASTGCV